MNRWESVVVGLVLGVTCPALTFIGFWWTSATVHMQLPQVPVGAVIASAFAGLGLGVALDVVYLRRWIRSFYTANVWILAAVYLGLSVGAVALFMGVPVGTFLLGIGSGVYVGRRRRHSRGSVSPASPSLRTTALFAATVTTAAALPMGFLALADQSVLESLATLLGVSQSSLRGLAGVALIGILCLVLFASQYCCSRIAGQLSFAIGGKGGRPGISADVGSQG